MLIHKLDNSLPASYLAIGRGSARRNPNSPGGEDDTVKAARIRSGWHVWRSAGIAALVATLGVVGAGTAAGQDRAGAVRAIAALDLVGYSGRWHEVGRLPNRFQSRCASDVTATYEVLRDSTIRVVNACLTTEGDRLRAEGRARLADRRGPASRLKVRFAPAFLSFVPMVWADYWVLDLTEGFRAALVGTPDRRYLWILSREPQLDQATYDRLLGTAAAQGFDVARVMRTGVR